MQIAIDISIKVRRYRWKWKAQIATAFTQIASEFSTRMRT